MGTHGHTIRIVCRKFALDALGDTEEDLRRSHWTLCHASVLTTTGQPKKASGGTLGDETIKRNVTLPMTVIFGKKGIAPSRLKITVGAYALGFNHGVRD